MLNNSCRKYSIKAQGEGASYATGGTYVSLLDTLSGIPEIGSKPIINDKAYTGQEGTTEDGIIAAALKDAKISLECILNPATADIIVNSSVGDLTIVETVEEYVYTKTNSIKACDIVASLPGNMALSFFNSSKTSELIGLKANNWSFKCAGEDQKFTFSGDFIGEQTNNDATFPTVARPTLNDYYWSGCSFEIGSVAETGTIRNIEISGTSNLTEFRDGNAELSEPQRRSVLPVISFDILDDAAHAWKTISEGQTLNQFQFKCTGTTILGDAATYPSVTFEFAKCRVLEVKENDDKAGLLMWTVKLEPIADSTTKVYGSVIVVDGKATL